MTTHKIDETKYLIDTNFTGEEVRITFQTYKDIIENVDHPKLVWSMGKSIYVAIDWMQREELYFQMRKLDDKNYLSFTQQRELLWQEERKKRIVEMEREYGDKELRDYENI